MNPGIDEATGNRAGTEIAEALFPERQKIESDDDGDASEDSDNMDWKFELLKK